MNQVSLQIPVTVQIREPGYRIIVLGPDMTELHGIGVHGLNSWSLGQLTTSADRAKAPEYARAIAGVMRDFRIRRAYAPNVADMSGSVIERKRLRRIKLMYDRALYRNPWIPADAVELRSTDEAFMMSSGGCAIIVAWSGKFFFVAHAGRDSLVDRGDVSSSSPRTYPSVVNSLVAAFTAKGVAPKDIHMRFALAIPPEDFRHHLDYEKHGEYNRQLKAYVEERWPSAIEGGLEDEKGAYFRLDLEKIFLRQAAMLGVQDVVAGHSLEKYRSLAHTRDGKEKKGEVRRNLVIVQREF